MRRVLHGIVTIIALLGAFDSATAAPVRMRYAEAPSHAFLVLTDLAGKPLASGELVQWQEKNALANRLVFRFADGSLYDERVRFSARPVFRVLDYRLIQHGPAFSEASDVRFDRRGRYAARKQPRDGDEQRADGEVALPDDVSNGMTATLLKNLGTVLPATVHVLAFTPKPTVVEVTLAEEGADAFWVGATRATATRFLVTPRVTGVKGAIASVVGRQPPPVRFWLTTGRVPTFVRFEGPLYADGPSWRIELASIRWKR